MEVEDCIFCKIVAGDIPAHIVFENEHTLAFLDIAPVNPGHTLIIPKKHSRDFLSTETEIVNYVYRTAQKVGQGLVDSINAEGVNITTNNDAAAGQSAFHWHVHAIPRHINDGHLMWNQGEYKEGEAIAILEKIKAAL